MSPPYLTMQTPLLVVEHCLPGSVTIFQTLTSGLKPQLEFPQFSLVQLSAVCEVLDDGCCVKTSLQNTSRFKKASYNNDDLFSLPSCRIYRLIMGSVPWRILCSLVSPSYLNLPRKTSLKCWRTTTNN